MNYKTIQNIFEFNGITSEHKILALFKSMYNQITDIQDQGDTLYVEYKGIVSEDFSEISSELYHKYNLRIEGFKYDFEKNNTRTWWTNTRTIS